ncbi:phage antirepressor [Pseudomonas daroniae]|uniref:Phage antirepressor n=1 Tax=Phytopseudomonas daroniae TaxID=2487519 RepID=A0A4Q9QMR6_9GAMM|nr:MULTISPECIES: Bro-N domain-containing protein [Pseudomonas]TBU81023.1 phage antirepressor [Pseudomonas daroniae]TBU83548.1 phage antirepressor [Pseudomonas sp. FRB 228]TBU87465.1 phage antirepressor [Pseudomonas daroniae]
MDKAFTPLVLMRHRQSLRGVMIDRQPWVGAREFARLLGHRRPERVCRLMDADQLRLVHFQLASGQLEAVEVLSESGMYRALCRFSHPENRHLRRWLSHVALPALRDSDVTEGYEPSRRLMAWGNGQVNLLEWQGELWVALDELPRFHGQAQAAPSPAGSWFARWWRGRLQAGR